VASDEPADGALAAEDLIQAAARFGYTMASCRPCEPVIDPGCTKCEGFGFVWRGDGGATLARSGMVHLASRGRERAP